MHKPMSTIIIVLLAAGIAWLAFFHRPPRHTEDDLKAWFSSRLAAIAQTLEQDIEKDRRGEYPHAGRQSFEKRGSITYTLPDKTGSRLEVSDKNTLGRHDIMDTTGYRQLEKKVQQLNLSMQLREIAVEGDGVESFSELDEYIEDYPRYYSVTISGW
jgi:hypothetical protein